MVILNSERYVWLFLLVNLLGGRLMSQQCYDNFEGKKFIYYNIEKSGHLDSLAPNPAPDTVNNSVACASYIRGRLRYDNIKLILPGKPENVGAYATYEGTPLKIRMKIYTNAPIGTLVEIQLGKRTNNPFPEGTHSQYQAITTVTGAWEELEFKFAQIPKGSKTNDSEIDQVTLLFYPNSNTSDIYYFDDLIGPRIITTPH